MAVSERLQVILELVTGQYKREAREASRATQGIADGATRAGGPVGKLSGTLASFRSLGAAAAIGAAGAAIANFAGDSIRAASDLGESVNAVNKVFGEASETVLQFGKVAGQAAGLSAREFNQLSSVTGAMLTNLGFTASEAANQTIRLTTRAADMASVFNTDVGSALDAINSGLKGEFNPLEQFAVKLSAAEVNARAVALGLAESTAAVDNHAKAIATLDIIMSQTAKTQGDFIQTADGFANSQRRAAAEMENAKAAFGEAFTPVAAGALDNLATNILAIRQALGDETATATLLFRDAMKAVSDAVLTGDDAVTRLADGLLHIASSGELTTSQFEALAAAAGLGTDQFGAFTEDVLRQAEALGIDKQILEEMEAAMLGTAGAAAGAAGGIAGVGDEAQTAADKLKAAADAQRALVDAMLEAASPAFAAIQSMQRLQAAQEHLIEVQEDSKSSAEDVALANTELAEAVLRAQGQLNALDASGVVAAADAIAAALGSSNTEALDLLETLGVLDGRKVRTVVETNFTRTGWDGGLTNTRGRGGPRASGGPVSAGLMHQVGEGNRPEMLLIPGDNGRVFSNQETRSLIAAMSGSPARNERNQNIYLSAPDRASAFEQVRMALAFDALEAV